MEKNNNFTVNELKERVSTFVVERDWQQFHNPKNLSMNIAVEASELMELLLWESTEELDVVVAQKKELLQKELADIFIGVLAFANSCNIDLATVTAKKLEEISARYPAEIVKGRHNAKELVGHKKGSV